MKVNYQFVNGERSEADVPEEWCKTLMNLDREEYNKNQKETRRHASLNAMDYEGEIFADDTDIEQDFIKTLDNDALIKAIKNLLPQQKELIERVYIRGEKLSDIAREQGVSKMALTNRMKKIFEKMKKVLY